MEQRHLLRLFSYVPPCWGDYATPIHPYLTFARRLQSNPPCNRNRNLTMLPYTQHPLMSPGYDKTLTLTLYQEVAEAPRANPDFSKVLGLGLRLGLRMSC